MKPFRVHREPAASSGGHSNVRINQKRFHVPAAMIAQQGPMLIPHFIGSTLQMQHWVSVDRFQPTWPTTRDSAS
jgi:hypothetical protein